jgi:hypothetical protein
MNTTNTTSTAVRDSGPLDPAARNGSHVPTIACDYCGHANGGSAVKCSDCGAKLAGVPDKSRAAQPAAPLNPVSAEARRKMVFGALWCLGGTLVTVFTYSLAASNPSGGTYLVAWGAILYGAVKFFQGACYRGAQPVNVEDLAHEALSCGTRLEAGGHLQEARAVYQQIVDEFGHTEAGRDARKSLETLQARLT